MLGSAAGAYTARTNTSARYLPILLPCLQPAEDQRLYKEGVLLEDSKSLAELKVENDDELAVAYRTQGKHSTAQHSSSRCKPSASVDMCMGANGLDDGRRFQCFAGGLAAAAAGAAMCSARLPACYAVRCNANPPRLACCPAPLPSTPCRRRVRGGERGAV